jgi:two-component system sensor histidine kinase QseC
MLVPIAERADRTLVVSAPDEVTMRGRTDDLRDMIWNLLDNALVHGAGFVDVTVRAPSEATEGKILVDVVDQGEGVPGELRERVFERFGKAVSTSPGAGLGLAIARQIARLHGGDVQFVTHATSCVRVTFPAETSPSDEDATEERPIVGIV